MSTYIVRVRTTGHELYAVDAESEEQARSEWHEGELLISEVDDASVQSVELEGADQ